jgi:hypothetical protein
MTARLSQAERDELMALYRAVIDAQRKMIEASVSEWLAACQDFGVASVAFAAKLDGMVG